MNAGSNVRLGAFSVVLALGALGLCAGGALGLFGSGDIPYSESERLVLITGALAVGAFLVGLTALIVAIVGLRRRPAPASGRALTMVGLVLSIGAILGVVALLALTFFYAVISFAVVT